jgi:spore coat polysaccharide biosynthesis protein SpsF
MKFAVLIQARLGSSRYPQKILKKIDSRSVIEYMIDQILKIFPKNKIIINTTNSKKEILLLNEIKKKKINFFRGSELNVLSRYVNCAKKFKVKNIIHVTSDCPLVDINLILKMKKIFLKNNLDYLANTYPPYKSTFPDGTDIEIYKYKSLIKLQKLTNLQEDKEHVTNFFWKNKNIFKTMILKNSKNLSNYKYSIDYKNEITLVKKIIKIMKKKKIKSNFKNIVKIIESDDNLKRISNTNLKKFKSNRKDLY